MLGFVGACSGSGDDSGDPRPPVGGEVHYLPAVESVRRLPMGEATPAESRMMTRYRYDFGGNYTGYPLPLSNVDSLLQSNSRYAYTTRVDSGKSAVEQTYNQLHLNTVTKTFASAGTNSEALLSVQSLTYNGEKDGLFPSYTGLPGNYQAPREALLERFGPDEVGSSLEKTEIETNDFGQHEKVTKFRAGKSGLEAVEVTRYTYAPEHFSMVVQVDVEDLIAKRTTRRIIAPFTESDANALPILRGAAIEYSQEGEVVGGEFEPERELRYGYDKHGRVIRTELSWAEGSEGANGPGVDESFRTVEYVVAKGDPPYLLSTREIDAKGFVQTTKTDTRNGFVKATVDALGNETTYDYDRLGRVKEITYPETAPGEQIVVVYSYDRASITLYDDETTFDANRTTVTYPNGYETYEYADGAGRVLRRSDNGGKDSSERVMLREILYDSEGLPMRVMDSLERVETKEYDAQGRVTRTIDVMGNDILYFYDDGLDGDAPASATAKVTTKSGGRILVESFVNSQGLTVLRRMMTGSEDDIVSATAEYDGMSRPTDVSIAGHGLNAVFTYGTDGQVLTSEQTGTDGTSLTSTFTVDLFGNVVTTATVEIHPGQDPAVYSSPVSTYDELNELISTTNALGQTLSYTHNANGQLQQFTNYDGSIRTFEYDALGRQTAMLYEDTDSGGKTYDYAERRKYENGQASQVTLTRTEQGTSTVETVSQISFEYSRDGSPKSQTYLDESSIHWTYDKFNRLETTTDVFEHVTTYTYFATNGLLKKAVKLEKKDSASDPDVVLASVAYTYYDRSEPNKLWNGRVHTVTTEGDVTTVEYDDISMEPSEVEVRRISDGAIVTRNRYEYDALSRLVEIRSSSELDPSSIANHRTVYSYSSFGDLIGVKVYEEDGSEEVSSTLLRSETLTYRRGNIHERIVDGGEPTVFAYNAINQLESMGPESAPVAGYTFGINGNLRADPEGNTYDWNALDQLVRFTPAGGTPVDYSYYVDGSRRSKSRAGDAAIEFYYDPVGPRIVNERQGVKGASYLFANGARVARLVDDVPHFYFSNGVSLNGTTDAAGSLDSPFRDYDAYGKPLALPGDPAPAASPSFDIAANPFRYEGHYHDSESGLSYMNARYYSPDQARFISQDAYPAENAYSFGLSNPIGIDDPTGNLNIAGLIGDLIGLAFGLVEMGLIAVDPVLSGAGLANVGGALLGIGADIFEDQKELRRASLTLYGVGMMGTLVGGQRVVAEAARLPRMDVHEFIAGRNGSATSSMASERGGRVLSEVTSESLRAFRADENAGMAFFEPGPTSSNSVIAEAPEGRVLVRASEQIEVADGGVASEVSSVAGDAPQMAQVEANFGPVARRPAIPVHDGRVHVNITADSPKEAFTKLARDVMTNFEEVGQKGSFESRFSHGTGSGVLKFEGTEVMEGLYQGSSNGEYQFRLSWVDVPSVGWFKRKAAGVGVALKREIDISNYTSVRYEMSASSEMVGWLKGQRVTGSMVDGLLPPLP